MRVPAVELVVLAALTLACSSEALSEATPSAAGTSGRAGGTGVAAGTAGTAAAGSAGAASVGSPVRAPYPSGPYGHGIGATIENLSFLGWRQPAASNYDETRFDVVRLSDFYNPGGNTNDVRVIVVNASAVWCSVCRSEYQYINREGIYAAYRPKGVEILGVIFEDNDYAPAKPEDLVFWGGPDGFQVTFPLVLDPGFKTGVYFASDATPLNLIIDATTMQIIDVLMGYDASDPESYWRRIDAHLGY